jgi:hypothetical protein
MKGTFMATIRREDEWIIRHTVDVAPLVVVVVLVVVV